MTLEEILKRPSKSRILEDKKVSKLVLYPRSVKSTRILANSIRNLKDDQVLIIPVDYDILPPGYGALREIHKGDLIKLRRYDSIDNAFKSEATSENLFIKALHELKEGRRYLGYEWQGITATTRNYRIVPFSETYQAQIIFANQSEDERIFVKPYTQAKLVSELGGMVITIVPSVKKERTKEYEFRFLHVPLAEKKNSEHNFIWFNILAHHECPEQTYYPLSYGRFLDYERGERLRKGDEKIFDAHEISAFKQLKKYFNESGERLKIFEDPFFFFSNYMFKLINKIRTQSLKEYLSRVDGKHELKIRPVNYTETSILIADQLAYEKHLLELKGIKEKIGEFIYKKFFNPRNLDFAVYKK